MQQHRRHGQGGSHRHLPAHVLRRVTCFATRDAPPPVLRPQLPAAGACPTPPSPCVPHHLTITSASSHHTITLTSRAGVCSAHHRRPHEAGHVRACHCTRQCVPLHTSMRSIAHANAFHYIRQCVPLHTPMRSITYVNAFHCTRQCVLTRDAGHGLRLHGRCVYTHVYTHTCTHTHVCVCVHASEPPPLPCSWMALGVLLCHVCSPPPVLAAHAGALPSTPSNMTLKPPNNINLNLQQQHL